MLQIAIWGICFLLIIKGMDVLHQQFLAVSAGSKGSPELAYGTFALAMAFAAALFFASENQASYTPSTPTFGAP